MPLACTIKMVKIINFMWGVLYHNKKFQKIQLTTIWILKSLMITQT